MASRKSAGRRKRDKSFVAIPFTAALTLGTLSDDTVITGSPMTLTDKLYIVSVDMYASGRGHTAGEGPLEVGLAHGDLTSSEIEENLQAEVTNRDSIIERERA